MFWSFFFKLLIGSVIVPFLFSFVIFPLLALLYLTMKKEENNEKLRLLSYPIFGLLFVAQLYFWGLWATYCGSLAIVYSFSPEATYKWFYYLVGFGFCTAPIGWLVRKELGTSESQSEQKGIQKGAAMYGLIVIFAYTVFSIWPGLMFLPYGWFLNWFY